MAEEAPVFVEQYCQGSSFQKNLAPCIRFTKIVCDVRRLFAKWKLARAEHNRITSPEAYEAAGEAYLQLWREYGAPPEGPPRCEAMGEILSDAGTAFHAAGRLGKSARAFEALFSCRF